MFRLFEWIYGAISFIDTWPVFEGNVIVSRHEKSYKIIPCQSLLSTIVLNDILSGTE